MEFVFLERTLVAFTVLEVLSALAIELSVMPVALILLMTAFPVQDPCSSLHSIPKLPLIPTSITPPESTSTIPLAGLELSFIDITFLASPVIDPPTLLLIKPKLTQIIIPSRKVQLPLPLQLSIMELPINDLVRILEETNPLTMWPIHLSLPNIHDLSILEELRTVKRRLHAQHHWRTVLHCQQLLQPDLDRSQLTPNKATLVVEVIKVKLGTL